MTTNQLQELLLLASRAADAADEAIMAVYARGGGESDNTEQKADDSPLTDADRAAHEAILRVLSESGIPVLSEEGSMGMDMGEPGDRALWLVDPLDGTREFIARNGEFTVNIALVEHGRPVLGVVSVPARDERFSGIVGLGARRETPDGREELGGLSDPGGHGAGTDAGHADGSGVRVLASRRHRGADTDNFIDGLRNRFGAVSLVEAGSARKICLLASGEAHLYPRLAPTMEWDTAAGHAVLAAVGGRMYALDPESSTDLDLVFTGTLSELTYDHAETHRNSWFVGVAPGALRLRPHPEQQ